MQEIFLRYFERGLSKRLEKVNFVFFLSNPFLFNGQNYQKQKGSGTSDSGVTLQVTKQVQKYSFMHYILSDQV